MAKIDDLVIQIKADTKQLRAELDKINGKIKISGAAGGAAFGSMGAALTKIKGPAIAAAAGIAAIAVAGGAIARVGAGFEDLKDSLNTVFGSIAGGDAAFDKILTFAQTTPFQVEDVTKAFIQLKGAGIEPSMDMLQTFADTASTSVDQLGAFQAMVRLVQRSAAGGLGLEEINQLDDRGIPATKILTEALGKTREELTEFGKTAEGASQMVALLVKGMQERFGGAMEQKMDNLSTKASNMMIAFRELADSIFNSGLGDILKNVADRLGELATNAARAMRMSSGLFNLGDVGIDTNVTAFDQLVSIDEKIEEIESKRARGTGAARDKNVQLTRLLELRLGLETQIRMELENEEEILEKGLVRASEKNVDFLTQFKKLAKDSVPELDKIKETMESVVDLRGKVDEQGNLIASEEEINRVLDFLEKSQKELATTTTLTEEMQQTIVNASNAFTTDFVDSLLQGENALKSFKNFARSIVSQIISIFMQMAVVNRILNSVFNLTGTDRLSQIDFKSPVDVDNFLTMAGGGTIQRGRPTLVGERGPEIFLPNTGGTIMNNMNSKNAMGGGTVVVNQSINFATGVVPTVRAEVTKMMPQIADVTKGAVAEAAMRGGNFRRMLQGG